MNYTGVLVLPENIYLMLDAGLALNLYVMPYINILNALKSKNFLVNLLS